MTSLLWITYEFDYKIERGDVFLRGKVATQGCINITLVKLAKCHDNETNEMVAYIYK